MPSVEQQLQEARQRLLDLSLRNRLLNYRPSKRRTIRVVDELPHEVFDILVLQGRTMHFLPVAEPAEPDDGDDPSQLDLDATSEGFPDDTERPSQAWALPEPEAEVADRHIDLALQTTLAPEALPKRLFHVAGEAERFVEEQGYTVLHVALGFLEWYHVADAEEPRRAPLALVPVRMERLSVARAFKVRWTEEEVSENISLRHKLKEYGVELPEFGNLVEKDDLIAWFEKIRRAIAAHARWRVVTDIAVDFFSFTKFVMYKDLDPAAWPEGKSPAESGGMRSVLDPESAANDGIGDGQGFDPNDVDARLRPADVHHVLDADPSQIAVVEDAKAGKNLVVEGPPGTGKSQTITNIIAELLAAGKKVLFVSEKMAALSVVKERLERVGLGLFCLEVHSRKANKRQFLEQIERSAKIRFPPPEGVEQEMSELESLRDDLNKFTRVMAEPLGELDWAPVRAFRESERARTHFRRSGRTMATVPLDDPASWTLSDLEEARLALLDLRSTLEAVTPISAHPWRGAAVTVVLPADSARLEALISSGRQQVARLRATLADLVKRTGVAPATTLAAVPTLLDGATLIASAPDVERRVMDDAAAGRVSDRVSLIDAVARYATLRGQLQGSFRPEAIDSDASRMLRELRPLAHVWWRWFSGRYRALRREIGALQSSGKAPPNELALRQLATLEQAIHVRDQITEAATSGPEAFGRAWRGENSDAESLKRIDTWLIDFVRKVERGEIAREASELAVTPGTAVAVPPLVEQGSDLVAGIQSVWREMAEFLRYDESVLPGSTFPNCPLVDLDRLLDSWEHSMADLVRWSAFLAQRARARETRASPIVERLEADSIHPDDLTATLYGNVADGVLRRAFEARPELARFTTESHEDRIRRFAELDRSLIEKNRLRLAARLSESRPRPGPGASPESEMGILVGQFNRKRGHLPIRQLMKRCGEPIKEITPCFMMSPLSVAQFLDPVGSPFDVVIFDEASQVRPEEALGALIRAKQVIVIGDTRQLPPTSFFDHVTDDIDDEIEDVAVATVGQMESILHQCRRSFPIKSLTWHYRSVHESLIAASNLHFYNNELRIFPSAVAAAPDLGLQFRHQPNTTYDRGRSTMNRGEARSVAEAVIRHYENTPEWSLGVGTFSSRQQQAVLEEVEVLRHQHPHLDDHFASDHHEHFFVKNLETIQGDERDVIFVSVGYGFDQTGKLGRNFGPVNPEGGERRLNVLFTRARRQCVVFSNFRHDELSLQGVGSRGVHVLKSFMEYSATGKLPEEEVLGDDPESPFESSVADALRSAGYEVAYQVGCAGFRVDLGVVDPDAPGRYMLGVECDGWKYHSSPVARDRDRLRQEILEKRGWTIHRVWSTDWYRSRADAEVRLLEAVDRAKRGRTPVPVVSIPDGPSEPVDPMAHATIEEFEEIAVPEYKMCTGFGFRVAGELHEQPRPVLAEAVATVVHVESPVHGDEVIRRIRSIWGLDRAGSRIREAVGRGIEAAVAAGVVVRRGRFLWSPEMKLPIVRRRGGDIPLDIGLVSPEELAVAVRAVLQSQFATPRDELVGAVARVFGIRRVGESVGRRVGLVVKTLLGKGILQDKDGRLVWCGKR